MKTGYEHGTFFPSFYCFSLKALVEGYKQWSSSAPNLGKIQRTAPTFPGFTSLAEMGKRIPWTLYPHPHFHSHLNEPLFLTFTQYLTAMFSFRWYPVFFSSLWNNYFLLFDFLSVYLSACACYLSRKQASFSSPLAPRYLSAPFLLMVFRCAAWLHLHL